MVVQTVQEAVKNVIMRSDFGTKCQMQLCVIDLPMVAPYPLTPWARVRHTHYREHLESTAHEEERQILK